MAATTHRARVEGLLTEAADEHEALLAALTPELQASLPVDAQGITRAIDHLAAAAGLTEDERRALIRPHAVNPAVMHARVFGRAPLARETVIGSFVDGARVRADALVGLADAVGGGGAGRADPCAARRAPAAPDRRGPRRRRGAARDLRGAGARGARDRGGARRPLTATGRARVSLKPASPCRLQGNGATRRPHPPRRPRHGGERALRVPRPARHRRAARPRDRRRQRVLSNMNRSDGALSAYAVTGRDEAFEDFRSRHDPRPARPRGRRDGRGRRPAGVRSGRRPAPPVRPWSDLVDRAVAAPTPAGRRAAPPRRHAGAPRGARRLRRRERAAAGPSGRHGGRRGPPRVVGPCRAHPRAQPRSSAPPPWWPATAHARRSAARPRGATPGPLRRGHPGLRQPGGGAPSCSRRHLERTIPGLDHHRAEPQQQRRPSRGEHAARSRARRSPRRSWRPARAPAWRCG